MGRTKGCRLTVEASCQLFVGRIAYRSGLPLGFADPGQEMIFQTKGTHLKRKARACMTKGVNIHGWSSTKVKKVAESVDMSQRPKI